MSEKPEYSMDREEIGDLYRRAWLGTEAGKSWEQVCRENVPSITHTFNIHGLEHIPEKKPIIIATNHPSHADYFFVADALEKRPDLRMVTRVPPSVQEKFPERSQFLNKASAFIPLQSNEHGTYVHESLCQLIELIRTQTSLIIVPWGCMDHQAAAECAEERAIGNIMRLHQATRACVIPTVITIHAKEDTLPGHMPFTSVDVHVHPAADSSQMIEQELSQLYRKATR